MPFSGASLTETIARITHAQPEAIACFNYDVPAELEVIIKKALRKNHGERYQTAHEMLIDLRDLQQDLHFASRLEHSVAPTRGESTPPASIGQASAVSSPGQGSTTSVPAHVSSTEPRHASKFSGFSPNPPQTMHHDDPTLET